MNKVIIFLIVFGAASLTGYGVLMPEIPNFFLQEVLIIEGRDQIGVVVDGEFTCECVPMPTSDTTGDGNDDCGLDLLPNGDPNVNCEPRPCKDDMMVLPNDFCSSCDPNLPAPPGGSGLQCDVAPNEEGPYFNSAAICNVVTTCP